MKEDHEEYEEEINLKQLINQSNSDFIITN